MSAPAREVSAARHTVAAVLERAGIGPGRRVVVALSGGSDSTALAAATLFVARHGGQIPVAVTVDHGLRPESAAEAAEVANRARAAGFEEALVVRVDARAHGTGPEAAARIGRYAALAEAARARHAPVLLAHTADDQAETVLLGLGRGSGARSLAGMAEIGPLPEHPEVVALRPFLGLRKEELRRALRSKGIEWVEDPTNAADSTWRAADGGPLTRSAIRHGALPALEAALGPGTVPALARTAALLRADADFLDGLAAEHVNRLGNPVSLDDVVALPDALRTRVFRQLAIRHGARAGELGSLHVIQIDALAHGRNGRARLDLPGLTVWREGRELRFGTDARGVRWGARKGQGSGPE